MTFLDHVQTQLEDLRAAGLLRTPWTVTKVDGARIEVDGRPLVNFASNDYLGLARNPALSGAAARAAREFGWGAGSARLLSGTTAWHAELERAVADFRGTEDAVVFPTGYMGNLGMLVALADRHDLVLYDRLVHGSLIDGIRLSHARTVPLAHRDVAVAREILKEKPGDGLRFLVTDSVFSMDGDLAPLRELADLANETGATLLVDDAHGVGVLGGAGRGALEFLGVGREVAVSSGTLSKAVGGLGGFVSGPKPVCDLIRSKARTFLFATAAPPAVCAAAVEGIRLVREGTPLRERLHALVRRFKLGLEGLGVPTEPTPVPIVPIPIGETAKALQVAASLLQKGFYAPAIRPPTVPDGTARLRISMTALHTEDDVDGLLVALREVSSRI